MPTAAVRISEPLPPFRPVSRRAVACIAAPVLSLAESTARVWFPMSLGREANHSPKPAATASNPAALRRSNPAAVTLATATDIDVSSVHSPGSNGPMPPPIMAISTSSAG